METLHRVSGNSRLGFILALTTALLWGLLAITLKLLLEGMDAFTITWYRLAFAALALGLFQARRGQLPRLSRLGRKGWLLLAVALGGLLGNYVFFVVALDYIPPATAQLVIQLAPILFLLGGLVIFRESFSRVQSMGLAVLVIGMGLFFNKRLPSLLDLSGRESVGVALVVVAGIVWAGYALAQKQLLMTFSSENILLLIYLGAAIVLLLPASPGQVMDLTGFQMGLLAFGIFNTLAAYGCFAEALEHWEATRVSAVISITPLLTIAAVHAILAAWPEANIGTKLDGLGVIGALLVVLGSAMTSLGGGGATRDGTEV